MGDKSKKGDFVKNDPRIRHDAHKIPPELKAIRELDKSEITLLVSEYLRKPKEFIKDILSNSDSPMGKLIVSKAVLKAFETGDFRYIQPYIEYIFGKPKEYHNLNAELGIIVKMIQYKGNNEGNTDTDKGLPAT